MSYTIEGITCSMGNLDYKIFYKRHLPHFQPPSATLFITFRLANSLPSEMLQRLNEEARQVERMLAGISDLQDRIQKADLMDRRLFGVWDRVLDAAECGPRYLQDRRIADLMAESLHHRENRVFCLDAFCIMPNHVHLVCKPLLKDDESYNAISSILHSLKRYTARQSNKILGKEGAFWQHENYDHVIRDEEEWKRIINYVVENPVKAGLVHHWREWEWTYSQYAV